MADNKTAEDPGEDALGEGGDDRADEVVGAGGPDGRGRLLPKVTGPTIADALATLSDRGLRRLLGARTFLRGLEYARRRIVEDVVVERESCSGKVKSPDGPPAAPRLVLTADGIKGECTCSMHEKTRQHCKHIAALLIAVREEARGAHPRPTPAAPAPVAAPPAPTASKAPSRRERRRQRMLSVGEQHTPTYTVAAVSEATAKPSGIGEWLPPVGIAPPKQVEFRVLVRGNGLTVTALDSATRGAMLPSVALSWQALYPTPDRDALRVLSRFESGNPRHPAVDVRGEDAAELVPLLAGRRVLLEPTLMQLRVATEEVLKPRFDLELLGDEIVAKVSFERGDRRRFQVTAGGWFEGAPGWHIDLSDGVARPIDRRVSPAALRRLSKRPTITESVTELVPLVTDGLPKVALEIGATLPELDQVADVIDLEPVFRLQAEGSITEARCVLVATYGETEVPIRADGISPPVILLPPEAGQRRYRCIRCDIPAQQAAAGALVALGLKPEEGGQAFAAYGPAAVKFWTDGLKTLPSTWQVFVPEVLTRAKVRSGSVVASAIVDRKSSSGMDWLSLKLGFEVDGQPVDRDELARCVAAGKKYVKLEDGSFAEVDVAAMKELLDREVEILSSMGKAGKIPLSQAGRIEELIGHLTEVRVSQSARELFTQLSGIEGIEAAKKPKALKATLRPYQEAGLSWLSFVHELRSGGVLADDMGLGKTLQTIALLCHVKQKEKKLRTLIVAPTSVVPNWARELQRFAPTLKAHVFHGPDRHDEKDAFDDAEVIVTSYPLIRRDEELLQAIDFSYVILDEAQHIKNPTSATAIAAKKLQAERRLALTGTPIENRLAELWSIFDFVSPGLLSTLDKFEERYGRPIDAGDAKAQVRLRATIHPFILRRTKLEVEKDLPEKIETDRVVEMTPPQKSVYGTILREVRREVLGEVEKSGVGKAHLHILAGLTRLRQAACDPRLLGLPKEFTDEDSGKLDALRELVGECVQGGHKVLVFSQFVEMLKLIRKALDDDGVVYEYLDGSTIDREARVDRFQTDAACSVFLISLKAGGTGLNLTAADTVVHFDPWWNPAVEEQASARAHRIGQSKVVTVYRLVAEGTIEEKILVLKNKKKSLVESVLSEDQGGSKKLTKADLEDLFRLD